MKTYVINYKDAAGSTFEKSITFSRMETSSYMVKFYDEDENIVFAIQASYFIKVEAE